MKKIFYSLTFTLFLTNSSTSNLTAAEFAYLVPYASNGSVKEQNTFVMMDNDFIKISSPVGSEEEQIRGLNAQLKTVMPNFSEIFNKSLKFRGRRPGVSSLPSFFDDLSLVIKMIKIEGKQAKFFFVPCFDWEYSPLNRSFVNKPLEELKKIITEENLKELIRTADEMYLE